MAAEERDWLEEEKYVPPIPREHVEHPTIGPPGTGKTTWLSRQCQNAAKRYGPEGVVVGSLTKAAAAEVAGRDTGIPPENIGTLHAHAFRALDRPPLAEVPEGIKAWNEACGAFTWRVSGGRGDTDDVTSLESMNFQTEGDRLLQWANVLRARRRDTRLWPPHVAAFYQRWCEWKTDTGRADFTDLIERAVSEVDHLPGDPEVIMLDEAQDMSALEMELARKWGAHAEQLVIVGDPDQCLYSWRGADPQAVFGTDLERIRVLSQSYRVPYCVHAAAVRMIDRIPGRLPVEYHPRVPRDAQDTGSSLNTALMVSDPDSTLRTIEEELAAERTVMVLTTCGYMLHPIVACLRDHGIPFHNPYRVTQGQWNPLAGAKRLLAFLRPLGSAWPGENRLWTWDDLRLFTEPMQAKGNLTRGSKALIEAKCHVDQFGESRAEQVVELESILGLFEVAHHDALMRVDVDWWESTLRHNEAKRQRFAIAAYRRGGADALKAKPNVIVGTIHSVKGGEADSVILFPDLSDAGYWDGLKRTGEPHNSVIRQFYVGMTRARHRLFLGAPSGQEAIGW